MVAQQMGLENGEGVVYIESDHSTTYSIGYILGFIGFSLLAITIIFGLITEFTPLFGKIQNEGVTDDSKKDKALVASKSKLGLFFLAFSPSRNLKKLFNSPQNKDDYLSVLNGLRVISMYHIVLAHGQGLLGLTPVINIVQEQTMFNTWWAIYLGIGFYSVDVFFFISAFLASYLMISKFQGKRFFNFGMVYLHRLIRVVPSILLFTAMTLTFFEMIGSGPIWSPIIDAVLLDSCKKNWWANVVFISSWYTDRICFGQLWYLANEMTFFLFVPFVVLVYINKRLAGIGLAIFF